MDGKLGVIPQPLADACGIEEIRILEVYEASTRKREAKGGYYFEKPENDELLRYKIIVSNCNNEREISSLDDLIKLYINLSKARKKFYDSPELAKELRKYNHYRRDGYL